MIRYRINLSGRAAHLYRVTLSIKRPAAQQAFSLPVWIPGSYKVREFSRHLQGLRARQGGREIALRQVAKNRWIADCSAADPLELDYAAYAFDASVREAWLDQDRGFFNGTSLCLRVEELEAQAHAIEFDALPTGWQVATAMDAQDGRYVAADYDELVDHPFELGTFWRGHFEAGGVPHEIVVSGALPVFDGARLLADAQRICAAQIAFWGELPFKRYLFLLNAVDEGNGGLEHRASTALIAARRDLPRLGQPASEVSDGHVRLLGLISHEYFHSWNVKRLRPAELARYDYERENHTELLWFFEGFTSYYDELFLLRAGLIDVPRYLKLLATTVNAVLAAPGRHVQSLAASSYEAWTKYYLPDENTPNAVVSYYAKGALVGLALDLSLRAAGSGLDALMQALWRRSSGGPIDEALIFSAVTELGGAALTEQLRAWVHGTEDLPLAELLAQQGVSWKADKLPLAQRLGLRMQGDTLKIRTVLSGSPAAAAGLSAGDELLASNQW
ncbi:MAG TPA: peptidase M61, partial [Burkholderiaceae bacterium]